VEELDGMTRQEQFWGTYKGLRYEIRKFPRPGSMRGGENVQEDTFAWYLLFDEKNFEAMQWAQMWLEPVVDDKGRVYYNYM